MPVEEIRCLSCGAPLPYVEGATHLTCAWCGTSFMVSAPRREEQRPVGIEADGTVRDRATGRGLFTVPRISGFCVVGTALEQTGSISNPYVARVALKNDAQTSITLANGDAGTRQSASLRAMTAMSGAPATQAQPNYAKVPNPLAVADGAATEHLRRMGATQARMTAQAAVGDLEAIRRAAAARTSQLAQAQGAPAQVSDSLAASVVRVYDFAVAGQPWRMACYVRLMAGKWGLAGMGGASALIGQVGGFADRIGQALGGSRQQTAQPQAGMGGALRGALDFTMGGGLIGKHLRERRADQGRTDLPSNAAPQQTGTDDPVASTTRPPQGAPSWCSPDFESFCRDGNIEWWVDLVASYVAPAPHFEEGLRKTFVPFALGCTTHSDVTSLTLMAVQQAAAGIQQSTNVALAQSQARFAAQQAAHRQQQAAFNSYNDSISAARDARQASFRAATNAQFAPGAAGSGGVGDFSEAIRGVNTFVTSDGREVELSVHSDVAYENQAGDVVGGSAGFDPGADWTQIPRT